MSAADHKYGTGRGAVDGQIPAGGTSVAGSIVTSQRANPRTAPNRWASMIGCTRPCGSPAHAIANSVVTVATPAACK